MSHRITQRMIRHDMIRQSMQNIFKLHIHAKQFDIICTLIHSPADTRWSGFAVGMEQPKSKSMKFSVGLLAAASVCVCKWYERSNKQFIKSSYNQSLGKQSTHRLSTPRSSTAHCTSNVISDSKECVIRPQTNQCPKCKIGKPKKRLMTNKQTEPI